MSGKAQPMSRSSMTTSPACGRGIGTSAYSSVDGSPHPRASIAFIVSTCANPSTRRGKMSACPTPPAPLCATFFGEFGAEVIKVEQPRVGDDLRRLGRSADGAGGGSYWWFVEARNKKSITCDLREPQGQALITRLVAASHVVTENFRPGTLE